jgi:curli biogenesis system outer membrane secretion channel CsgG
MKTRAAVVSLALLFWMSSPEAHSQARMRVAVFEFDARAVEDNGANNNIGVRVADGLISNLAGSGNFDVVDRDNLDRIMQEQSIGQGARFDANTAAKIGKLANVNLVILGRIESATESVKLKHLFGVAQVANINIRATSRVIQVDTGNILNAPTGSCEIKDGEIGNGIVDPR